MHKKAKKRATPEITVDLHNSLFSRPLKSRILDTHLAEVSPTDPLVLTRAIGSRGTKEPLVKRPDQLDL